MLRLCEIKYVNIKVNSNAMFGFSVASSESVDMYIILQRKSIVLWL